MRGDFRKRGDRALVALDGNDAARALRQQRPRQSAGAGADFDDGHIVPTVPRRARSGR